MDRFNTRMCLGLKHLANAYIWINATKTLQCRLYKHWETICLSLRHKISHLQAMETRTQIHKPKHNTKLHYLSKRYPCVCLKTLQCLKRDHSPHHEWNIVSLDGSYFNMTPPARWNGTQLLLYIYCRPCHGALWIADRLSVLVSQLNRSVYHIA